MCDNTENIDKRSTKCDRLTWPLGWNGVDRLLHALPRPRPPAPHPRHQVAGLGRKVSTEIIQQIRLSQGRKEKFYLTMHSTHFIYGYIVKDH